MLFNRTMDYLVVGVYQLAGSQHTEQCIMHNTTKREAKQQMIHYLNNKLTAVSGSFSLQDIVSIEVRRQE